MTLGIVLPLRALRQQKTEDTKKTPSVVVYVDGAVVTPGSVHAFQETPRICDAVDAAGGPSDTADISELNLAKPIKDGDKIHVPQEGEKQVPSSENSVEPSSKNSEQSLVNINVATEEELTKLPESANQWHKQSLKIGIKRTLQQGRRSYESKRNRREKI